MKDKTKKKRNKNFKRYEKSLKGRGVGGGGGGEEEKRKGSKDRNQLVFGA